ncbi:hypothetical protein JIQ42_04230 [Leishmania sp. Namibia]|uniref:hypothetical protein n=1 Tax=Leishmania sp. Namibia TaxID=2802991 RepID=UPI001B777993|nr:hypothetical protein JIQ42_04230 [Leishmania sp. Namibia]
MSDSTVTSSTVVTVASTAILSLHSRIAALSAASSLLLLELSASPSKSMAPFTLPWHTSTYGGHVR